MILDTSFLIDLIRGKEPAAKKSFELDKLNQVIFITSVSLFELWQHADLKNKDKIESLERLLDLFGILYLDAESAKNGGKIYSELVEKGATIDPEDCMIAGIAIHHSMPVLTRDQHFSRIKGIKVETY